MKRLTVTSHAGPFQVDRPCAPNTLRKTRLWAASVLLLAASLGIVQAENTNLMVKPPVPIPGGLGLYPVITSVTRTQDVVNVQWFGLQGPFTVLHATSADSPRWLSLGPPTYGSNLTTSISGDLGFFRVLSGTPTSTEQTGGTMDYVGSDTCELCHLDTHQEWSGTAHAHAFDRLKAVNQQNNSQCLVCHTVGFATPLGFKNEATTPQLANVQCENCHGPGGAHVANVRDPSVRPKVTMAAEMCGGCHDYHHPTYDEWKQSAHSTPVPDVASSILQGGEPRMLSCGVCHSGAVRESLLEGLEHPGEPLPSRVDAAYFGVTCAVCHDAHAATGLAKTASGDDAQLRNPLYSTQNFSYSTSASTTFAAQYNPDIQLCGQCHNMRGARWQDTSRPPHHSPQYNMLIGQGAYDLGKPIIAAHGSEIDTQCVYCHNMRLTPPTGAYPGETNYTGHTFQLTFEGCALCHITSTAAEHAVTNTQANIKQQIASVKGLLDTWATTKAPDALKTKYGPLAWEYTIPGELSNPTNNASITGPTTAEQAQVPDTIKQARMNLYLVQYDGSFGVHNGTYSRYLLGVATTNVNTELAKP